MDDPRILGNGGLIRQLQIGAAHIIRTEIEPFGDQSLHVITNQDGGWLEKLERATEAAWITVVVGLPKWRIEASNHIVVPLEIRILENCRLNRIQEPYRTGCDVMELIAAALWNRSVTEEWVGFREFEGTVLTEAPDLVHQLTTTTRTLGHTRT